ncbi:TPA: hypothetical protein HA318_00705 [Candidatus Micrarchaeota archaeon]|nr:hypothetical protein [Candidatus Micrarchaeota archaeon]
MKIVFSEEAQQDFCSLDGQLKQFFQSHFKKLLSLPPRRHLQHGVPHHAEDVTRQARLVFDVEDNATAPILWVVRCFATHKEYEKWFRSYQ